MIRTEKKPLQLPIDFEACSVAKQKFIKLGRQPKSAVETDEEITTTFDPLKYV